MEAGASGVDLKKFRGHERQRARVAMRATEKKGFGMESKMARLHKYTRPGGTDRKEGSKEMSTRRMLLWASRLQWKVSIAVVRKCVTRIERQLPTYNNAL